MQKPRDRQDLLYCFVRAELVVRCAILHLAVWRFSKAVLASFARGIAWLFLKDKGVGNHSRFICTRVSGMSKT